MADATKYVPIGGGNLHTTTLDLKNLFSILKTRTTLAFAYVFIFLFIAFTVFLAFSPSPNASSPWFTNIFSPSSSTTSPTSSKSQLSSIFSYFFPNTNNTNVSYPFDPLQNNTSSTRSTNATSLSQSHIPNTIEKTINSNITSVQNSSQDAVPVPVPVQIPIPNTNNTKITNLTSQIVKKEPSFVINQTSHSDEAIAKDKAMNSNQTKNATAEGVPITPNKNLSSNSSSLKDVVLNNYTASLAKKQNNKHEEKKKDEWMESLMKCDFFDGEWVKDDSYPLYKPGSCSVIDEQFNCIGNGRPDKDYQKYKWKPKGCSLPRLDGHKMLDLLRGKRLVFVGDSLNRNMWESLICILRNSVKDKRKVYEANGRVHFRGEASYSFVFQDYKFSVELFVSPFLVQEWEMPDKNGTKKETLRLDLVGRSSDQYKDADIIVFNTGHWWTHDKTSKGKDYYQEGSHVYDELNVLEAFRRAITTWSRWVDANVNPSKSIVLFRGYSASHFSGGQWNSGGQCDSETAPIDNEKYLTEYPPKMRVLEKVLNNMKTHVTYLNITRMTDFRKDGHPSIYRKHNLSPEEQKSPLRFQDCSHWCLPGVPDTWNEILYAELLIREYRNQQQKKRT
ncbi:protein trichome birefringence [Cicer arietinum]|uniref:Protein trichome birefringence n=1 Tax=Cicer arietinum TaxID=3827 RepID=A0A1S2XRY1_CICAR|nr:protein trichome birefringence [Cicer arietinum]